MKIVNYISVASVPIIITLIVGYGLIKRYNVYDIFMEGVKEGIEIVINIFPTLIGIFVAVGMLRNSGIMDLLIKIVSPVTNLLGIPDEIMPLALIRPISGGASTAVATDIMKVYGVDSKIGLVASTIMGSTETTLYTIAIYTSSVGIKKTKYILFAALLGDLAGILASVIIWRFLS